jgi:hypothetical protein
MRYSPDGGRHIVMERGQHPSDGPRRIEVCEATTGAVLATFAAGFNPRWAGPTRFYAESPDGVERATDEGAFGAHYFPANRGQLDAHPSGAWAVSDLSRTVVWDGSVSAIAFPQARDPRIAPHPRSYIAVRHPATGNLRMTHRAPEDLGPCEDARWSSETLVWWLGGRVWGRTTPDASTIELTVPGRSCSHACPYWDGARLWVGLVLDEGELWLCEWSDLVARNSKGWRVGASSGGGFDWAISNG